MTNVDTAKSCLSTGQISNTNGHKTGCNNDGCAQHGGPGCVCRIAELNDKFRTSMHGGIVHMTNGIAGLGLPAVNAIFLAVASFTAFTQDNDPWSEHDCVVMEVEG